MNVQLCSHCAVSPCWMEQRHESASTQRGGYNTYGMHPWSLLPGPVIRPPINWRFKGATLIRFRNSLTKSGGISIKGVFQHLEVS